MSSVLNVSPLPPDPLLGLITSHRDDPRDVKVDLGVGVYREEDGTTPIMKAVQQAELQLASNGQTKSYEGPRGNEHFCESIESLLLAGARESLKPRLASLATPGGCGALYLGIQLAKRAAGHPRVWISDPSWPNHNHLAASSGLETASYGYLDEKQNTLDFTAIVTDLKRAKRGDIVVLQGPCHNPSGVDLTLDEWKTLAYLVLDLGLIPIIDVAYHGLGHGLDQDMDGIRAALSILPEAIITYSCSKNFGLYRERTGCLIILAETEQQAYAATTHAADIARACYSMPPAHGAAIVATILNDAALRATWTDELEFMRQRLKNLRSIFSDALCTACQTPDFKRIGSESGMFSLLPMRSTQAQELAEQYGVYLPGSGRINIAGLTQETTPIVANAYQSVCHTV